MEFGSIFTGQQGFIGLLCGLGHVGSPAAPEVLDNGIQTGRESALQLNQGIRVWIGEKRRYWHTFMAKCEVTIFLWFVLMSRDMH